VKPNSKLNTILDVDHARQEVEFAVDAFLKARGWKSTCSNPASLWLWEKTLDDGRVMLTDKDTAILFERLTYAGDETEG
jgi:hypothetical protein